MVVVIIIIIIIIRDLENKSGIGVLTLLGGAGRRKVLHFGQDNNYYILAIFYPPLKYIWGCVWLFLQAQEGNVCFTELAERVEYGNYVLVAITLSNEQY